MVTARVFHKKYIVSTRPGKRNVKVHLRDCLCENGKLVLRSTNEAYHTFDDESERLDYDGTCTYCWRKLRRAD